MKIDGKYPKIPPQEKNIQKGKELDGIDQKRLDARRTAGLGNKQESKFVINKMREKIDAEPDINMEKVKALRAKIKNGEYKVDAEKLADNLVKNSLLEDLTPEI